MKVLLGHTLADSDGVERNVSVPASIFTNHAVVFGASGSGKTGCILGLAEEVTKSNIPVILVDIKGDMANIALRNDERLSVRCLTPGGVHGEPVNVFADLASPNKVTTAVSALLSMIGEDSNPITSRTHTYVSTIINKRLAKGQGCSLLELVHAISNPGFHHIGALDIDVAFPSRSRTALASKVNNLLAAPSFQAWREGVALRMEELLEAPEGKTPVLVYSVAHLVNQAEQEYALGIFLDEVLAWTKRQGGTKDLRSMLIIDECVGLIPPHPANPPTKAPLMTLMKQARAFGLGIVLSTQNPIDVDYKAVSNCSTWIIGRLTMDRDRERIVNALVANTNHPKQQVNARVASLQPRQFMIVRPGGYHTITSRTTDCELPGPMIPEEIKGMYDQGKLVMGDMEAQLRQRLHIAKRMLTVAPSDELYMEIARLEAQLRTHSKLQVINGGAS